MSRDKIYSISLCFLCFFYQICSAGDLIVEPEDGLNPLIQQIKSAKKSIDISIYQFVQLHKKNIAVIVELQAAHSRGVKINIILNRFSKGDWPTNGYKIFKREMRWCNRYQINCIPASSKFVYNHNKYIIFDNEIVYLMTNNLTYNDFSQARNFMLVLNSHEDLNFFEKLFLVDKNNAYTIQKISPYYIPAHIVLSPIDSQKKLIKFLHNTDHLLLIYAMYVDKKLPTPVTSELINLLKRHTEIVIITNKNFSKKILKQLSKYKPWIKIKYVDEAHDHLFIHAKVFVQDNLRAFLGSVNLSDNSLNYNREVSYITDDRAVVAKLKDTFNNDWQRLGSKLSS